MSYRVELWDGQKLINCWDGEDLEDLIYTNEAWTIYDEILAEVDEIEEARVLAEVEEELEDRPVSKGTGLLGGN